VPEFKAGVDRAPDRADTGGCPGWYGDPRDAAQSRYWDGSAWTDATRPQSDTLVAPASHDLFPLGTATGTSARERIVVHLVGALAYFGGLGLGIVGIVIVTLTTMYQSGESPSTVDRLNVKLGYLMVAAMVSAVPAVVGMIARRRHTTAVPWFILAGLTALWTVLIALNASPVQAPVIY
jgi:hypothetical protein